MQLGRAAGLGAARARACRLESRADSYGDEGDRERERESSKGFGGDRCSGFDGGGKVALFQLWGEIALEVSLEIARRNANT